MDSHSFLGSLTVTISLSHILFIIVYFTCSRVMASERRLFDLSDLENTVGSWDMYGQEDQKRYNGLQSEFFERAAGGLTRREYLNALVALGGGAALLVFGAKGAKDANLPITVGPQKGGEPGPRGRK